MNKLIVLLLISFTTSIDISAQSKSPFSNEALSIEYDTYLNELQTFISSLEDVPENFDPQSINDFEEYLVKNPSSTIQNLNESYQKLIEYMLEYEAHHGIGTVEAYFDNHLNDAGEMPDCFDTWYATEVSITVTAVACCLTGVGCPACVLGGALASAVNQLTYEDCMEQYDDNP